jgi:hypothetical protein
MQAVTTIGLDIAKSVFQVHGIDAEGALQRPDLGKALHAVDGPGSHSLLERHQYRLHRRIERNAAAAQLGRVLINK